MDTKLGRWHYAGTLNLIDNKEGGDHKMEVNYKAEVVASSGTSVRMRKNPSLTAAVARDIPLGVVVTVIEEYNSAWDKIAIDGSTGYMMSKFLKKVSEEEPDGGEDYITISIPKEAALALLKSLQRSEAADEAGI